MWETVSGGRSGATVTRRGGVYRKTSDDPGQDLPGEGARLTWLRDHGIPAPEVLECGPGLLVTAGVPGRPASGPWPDLARVTDSLADLTRALHALPIAECPFDSRLAVTVPAALAADVDLADLDEERLGWSRDQLVARLLETRPADEDLAVCHGDLCLPNVLLDPATYEVTGVIDAGRLGVADRWTDLALTPRSMTAEINPEYDASHARRFLARYGIEPDPAKREFYRLLDEFF